MALSKEQVREYLSEAGVDREHMSSAVEKIINGHLTSIDALREEISELKKSSEQNKNAVKELEDAKKELGELKKKVKDDEKAREGKDYDKLKKEFDDYKAEQIRKAERQAKEAAYKEILKDAGIPERHFEKILKYSPVDEVELDEKGKIKTAKDIMKSVKEDWGDHIETMQTQGAEIQNPPENNGGKKMTNEEIYKRDEHGRFILTAAERQKAIAENMEQNNS